MFSYTGAEYEELLCQMQENTHQKNCEYRLF